MPAPFERAVIVLDEDYGDRLDESAARASVWAIDSAANHRAWTRLEGRVALCAVPGASSAEERLLRIVETIIARDDDAPAGAFPYPILSVVGMPQSDTIEAALRAYGLASVTRTPDGFVATRPPD
jgi:hypothetical protein